MRSRAPRRAEHATIALRPSLATVLAGVALVLGALTFGATPLLVAGVSFALIGVLTPTWVLACAHGAHVNRRLSERRIVEEDPLEVTIAVRRGHLGLPGAEILDPLARASVPLSEHLSPISGKRVVELRIVTRAHRRGRHTYAAPSLLVSDPLGLVLVTKAGDDAADELLVLPRTEAVRWRSRARQRPEEEPALRTLTEPIGTGEIDGLRPYVAGAPATRIHWPALARGAGLLERRIVSDPHIEPLVVLDAREDPRSPDGAWLDAAVRAAASLTLELARTGGASVLLPGIRVPIRVRGDLTAWPAVHTRLALVEPAQRAPAMPRRLVPGATIIVAAAVDERLLANRGGGAGLVLVLPVELGERVSQPPSFEVSGCAGYVLTTRATRRSRRAA